MSSRQINVHYQQSQNAVVILYLQGTWCLGDDHAAAKVLSGYRDVSPPPLPHVGSSIASSFFLISSEYPVMLIGAC